MSEKKEERDGMEMREGKARGATDRLPERRGATPPRPEMADQGPGMGAPEAGMTHPGYMEDALGRLVPEGNVPEVAKLRDELVRRLCREAWELAGMEEAFAAGAMAEMAAFAELAAREHGLDVGGEKGNMTLTSFDGRLRVNRRRTPELAFNETMSVAREAILGCVRRWTEGANANLAEIVRAAFETDSQGHLSLSRVLGLRTLRIADPEWAGAMAALDEAMQVVGTRTLVRCQRRNGRDGKWETIGGTR